MSKVKRIAVIIEMEDGTVAQVAAPNEQKKLYVEMLADKETKTLKVVPTSEIEFKNSNTEKPNLT